MTRRMAAQSGEEGPDWTRWGPSSLAAWTDCRRSGGDGGGMDWGRFPFVREGAEGDSSGY